MAINYSPMPKNYLFNTETQPRAKKYSNGYYTIAHKIFLRNSAKVCGANNLMLIDKRYCRNTDTSKIRPAKI